MNRRLSPSERSTSPRCPLVKRACHSLLMAGLLGLSFIPIGASAAELDYQAGPVDNPLKGLVPYPNSAAANRFPHSMEFGYIPLRDVLDVDTNGDYEFDWSSVESFLDTAKARGNQGILRIYSEYPGNGVSIPQFLVDAGVTVTELDYGSQTAWTPDYENADFIDALKATIAALGSYDGDERIAFLELGLLGVWGEWHNFGHPTFEAGDTLRGEILQAYDDAFATTKLLTRYPRGAADGDRSNVNHAVGYHDDSFTWNTLGTAPWKFMQLMTEAAALDKWQTEPIGGELFPELNACVFEAICTHEGTAATNFADTVQATHATYMRVEGVFQQTVSEARLAQARAAVRGMGYDLHFSEATITPAGNDFTISATLENKGVAPFYYNWPVTVGLLDADGATLQEWPTSWRIDGLLPDGLRNFSATFSPTLPAPIGAQVALRVIHPMTGGRPLRFSNFNQQPDGQAWMILGGADGAAPLAAPEKVLFIRGGSGTVGFLEGGSDEQAADAFNYTTAGGNHSWGELSSALVAEGFKVEQLTEDPVIGGVPTPVPLDVMDLAQYSVIVFGSNNAEYTTAQIDAFMDFIEDGGGAVFVSDANFGQDWGDAPSSDTQFLERFGLSMNQDNGGTYDVRRTDEFVVPGHPILVGVDSFDGEGVSPVTRGTPPAGVTSAVITEARFGVTPNTGPTQGTSAPATAADASLVVATFGEGRVAGHFDRNTFFNENGAGTNINRLDNETYARNLFNWLAGNSITTGNQAPRGHFPTLLPGSTLNEGNGFATTVVAKDPDGSVTSVALKVDSTTIATDLSAPYEFNVPGLSAGTRIITATITDDLGATTDVDLEVEVLSTGSQEQPLDRSSWILSATNNTGDLNNAIDGDIGTRWATQQAQQPGQQFSIDFGQRELFQRIVLETPDNPDDYPRGYIVRGSDDGINFDQIASGAGAGATTDILLAEPVTYRYVEIEQTGTTGGNWWSIHEINILHPPANALLPLSSWLQFYYASTPPALLADTNGNGMSLLEEYAYNANPFTTSTAFGPSASAGFDPADQKYFIDLSFRRWQATGDVDYVIEGSTDLNSWASAGLETTFLSSPQPNGDGTETVTARVKSASQAERLFVRLQINTL